MGSNNLVSELAKEKITKCLIFFNAWSFLEEITKKIKSINYYKNKAKYLRQLSYQLIKINQEKEEKNLTSQEKEQKTTF